MKSDKCAKFAQFFVLCVFVSACVLYPPIVHAGQTIKIMTLNIHGFKSKEGHATNMDLLRDVIRVNNVDLVALQEVKYRDKALALMHSVFDTPPVDDSENFIYKDSDGTELAIFSKYKISLAEPIGAGTARAVAVNLDISPLAIVGVATIPIINLHPKSEHQACTYVKNNIANAGENGPVLYPIFSNIPSNQVVLGDFNMVFRFPLAGNNSTTFDNRPCVNALFPMRLNAAASAKYYASCGGEDGLPNNQPNTVKSNCFDEKSLPGASDNLGGSGIPEILDYVIVDSNSDFKLTFSDIINSDDIVPNSWANDISDHYAVIATLEYLPGQAPPQQPPQAATSTPTPTAQQQAAGQNAGGGRGMAIGGNQNSDDYMYYGAFAICYFMLMQFGFANGRKFRLGEIGAIVLLGLGAVYFFGLMGGIFVLFLGSFLLFM